MRQIDCCQVFRAALQSVFSQVFHASLLSFVEKILATNKTNKVSLKLKGYLRRKTVFCLKVALDV